MCLLVFVLKSKYCLNPKIRYITLSSWERFFARLPRLTCLHLAADGNWTHDLILTKDALYHLSYSSDILFGLYTLPIGFVPSTCFLIVKLIVYIADN